MNDSDTYSNSVQSKRQNRHQSRSYLSFSYGVHHSVNSNDRNDNTPQRIPHNTSHLQTTENRDFVYGTNISVIQIKESL